MSERKIISIISPVFNEEKNISMLYEQLKGVTNPLPYDFEFIFVNDGSEDKSIVEMKNLRTKDPKVMIIDFSRNFGKEIATTAGINYCHGDACIMIDADLQHPVEKIPEFIEKWTNGAEVVVGVRNKTRDERIFKKVGSYLFYKIINSISDMEIVSQATDFRLMDRIVIDEFNKLTERNRMTRALIDWLGFRRDYVYFTANQRFQGKATYSFWMLLRLAFNSVISFSLFPLRVAGYLGMIITVMSGMIGIFIFITKYLTKTMYFTGPAILAVIILFLIGIVLICLGLIALYIANIHSEVSNRPIYIIRKSNSNIE
ncbi:MAG TPA: glycosyltransferase family 2 protein [Patescibacteria group bacterium]|nr:glycosyltransferase family 2 protein [Patescibacteria group bacterium]